MALLGIGAKEQPEDGSAAVCLCASASRAVSAYAAIADVLALPPWFSREKGLLLAWAGPVLPTEVVAVPEHTPRCQEEAGEV